MPGNVRAALNPTLSGRTWGDGANRTSEHVIEDISFEQGMVRCECGDTMYATDTLSTEDVWDIHRGKPELVTERNLNPEYAPGASDAEVHDFLELVADPAFEFTGDET